MLQGRMTRVLILVPDRQQVQATFPPHSVAGTTVREGTRTREEDRNILGTQSVTHPNLRLGDHRGYRRRDTRSPLPTASLDRVRRIGAQNSPCGLMEECYAAPVCSQLQDLFFPYHTSSRQINFDSEYIPSSFAEL